MADFSLADAVDSPKPLSDTIWIPWQIVVDHQMGTLKVDSLAGSLCRERSEPTPKPFRTCCVGQTLQSCSRSTRTRAGQAHGGQGKMMEAMGLTEKTACGLIQ